MVVEPIEPKPSTKAEDGHQDEESAEGASSGDTDFGQRRVDEGWDGSNAKSKKDINLNTVENRHVCNSPAESDERTKQVQCGDGPHLSAHTRDEDVGHKGSEPLKIESNSQSDWVQKRVCNKFTTISREFSIQCNLGLVRILKRSGVLCNWERGGYRNGGDGQEGECSGGEHRVCGRIPDPIAREGMEV